MSADARMQKVGVLIPTRNRRDYLRVSLESALTQSHDVEIIVIDNGSTDGTAELMASLADPRVRYVVNPRNLGMAGSINEGISRFSDAVEWCTILSDDDLLDAGFVRSVSRTAAETRARSVVHSHRVFIDAGGERIRDALPAPPEETALEYLGARSRRTRETYLTGVLFHRRAFHDVGGYPVFSTGLASDDALLFSLALRDRLIFDGTALAFVRVHTEAESRTARDGLKKLETVDEFCGWCRRAFEREAVTGEQARHFERILQSYRRGQKSHWWQVSVRAALSGESGYVPGDAARLRALVTEDPAAFSLLIRLSVWTQEKTGFDIEASTACRAAATSWNRVMGAIRGRSRIR